MSIEYEDSGNRKTFSTGSLRDRPAGKGMFHLISPIALRRLALRHEVGEIKYGDGRNWEKGMPISTFVDSAMRHICDYVEGKTDEDHLAASVWNLMCIMHLENTHPEMQDLPFRRKKNESENKP